MSTPTTVYALDKPSVGGDAGAWGTLLNTNLDDIDSELARPRIIHNSPTVGATTTCDLANGRVFGFTVGMASTLAFTNVPTSAFAVFVDLLITNGGAFALTFPASVTWLAGVAPSLQVAGVDHVRMVTRDGGTTWFADHQGAVQRAGTFQGGSGAVGSPSLSFHTDPDTGLYRSGANELSAAVGGAQRAVIKSSGIQCAGGAFISADNSTGITQVIAIPGTDALTHTLTFKNGILTAYVAT